MPFVLPHKEYEKPEGGMHFGVLADVVDLGMVTTTFNNQSRTVPMVRFVWILAAIGKDGKNLQVSQRFNASSDHEKSNIYKNTKQILGVAPPPGFDYETLIGSTRLLLINREKSPDGTKDFANIMGILPAKNQAGEEVRMQVPADFVRDKNKPQQEQARFRQQQNRTQAQPATAAPVSYGSAPAQPVTQGLVPPPVPTSVASVQQLAPQTYPTPVPQGADVKF